MAVYRAKEFGAKADGVTKDTAAIQRAIDICAQNGGGRVLLEDGTFLKRNLIFKELCLSGNCRVGTVKGKAQRFLIMGQTRITIATAMRPNWIVAFCSHKMQRILV